MEMLYVLRTCHYQQEILGENIGACTSNLAVIFSVPNGKGIDILYRVFMIERCVI